MIVGWDCLEPHSYTIFNSTKKVNGVGENLWVMSIGSVLLTVQTNNLWYNEIVIDNVLHYLNTFTNIFSIKKLHQNGYYLHGIKWTVNWINNGLEMLAIRTKNVLYMFKTIYKPSIASVVKLLASLKLCHRRLGYPSWGKLTLWGNVWRINTSNMKPEWALLFY